MGVLIQLIPVDQFNPEDDEDEVPPPPLPPLPNYEVSPVSQSNLLDHKDELQLLSLLIAKHTSLLKDATLDAEGSIGTTNAVDPVSQYNPEDDEHEVAPPRRPPLLKDAVVPDSPSNPLQHKDELRLLGLKAKHTSN